MTVGTMLPLPRLSAGEIEMLRDVEYFLSREAWLLDHDKLEDWLTLLDPDIRYFAPVRSSVHRSDTEPSEASGHVAHFDDTIETLTMRVKRLRTGQAWSEDPRSRVRRFVSNVVLLSMSETAVFVGSNILIHREGADEPAYKLSAYRQDQLALIDGGLRLKERLIMIDHVVVPPLSLLM